MSAYLVNRNINCRIFLILPTQLNTFTIANIVGKLDNRRHLDLTRYEK